MNIEKSYPLTVNVSHIEWLIIQRLREIEADGYGELQVKIESGYPRRVIRSIEERHELLGKLEAENKQAPKDQIHSNQNR